MSRRMKYILNDNGTPYIFPDHIDHSYFRSMVCPGNEILGAGFVCISDNKYHCFGKSVSLKVESRNETDSDKLNQVFGLVEVDL